VTKELEKLLQELTTGRPLKGWDGFIHHVDSGEVDYIIFDDRAISDPLFIDKYLNHVARSGPKSN
jgi:hypothetical protein